MTIQLTRLEKFLLLFIAILIILFGVDRCSSSRSQQKQIHDISVYKDTVEYYTDRYDHQVASNSALVLQDKKQILDLIAQNQEFSLLVSKYKTVNSVVQVKTEFKLVHDTVSISLPCPQLEISPIVASKKDSLLFLKETIHENYFTIDTLEIYNKQSIVTGYKKIGLFKSELRTEIINSNPLVKVVGIQSYVTQLCQKKWYERPVIWGVAGVVVGSILSK